MATLPMLVIYNRHAPGCGEPPGLDNYMGDYRSYFENEHGEQWIFVYDRAAGEATLYGGDIGWEEPVTMCQPSALEDIEIMTQIDLVLAPAELTWLKACWMAAATSL